MDSIDAPPPRTRLPDWAARHLFDVVRYHRMGEAGILGRKPRVELLEGEIVEMSPAGARHIVALIQLTGILAGRGAGRARFSVQSPIRLDQFSEPEPDVAILRLKPEGERRADFPTAADVLLLIEVSDSSLRFDREVKLPLYARHGIPEVWIVDLPQRVIEIYAKPEDGRFTQTQVAKESDEIAPSAFPDLRFRVADILPEP